MGRRELEKGVKRLPWCFEKESSLLETVWCRGGGQTTAVLSSGLASLKHTEQVAS